MKAWWQRLSTREQRTMFGGLVLLAVALYYVAIYEPLGERKRLAQVQWAAQSAVLDNLQKTLAKVEQLRATTPDQGSLAAGLSGIAFINKTVLDHRLQAYVQRILPRKDGITLSMSAVPFDLLVRWLAMLATKHAIHTTQISVDALDGQAGAVNVSLTLAVASS